MTERPPRGTNPGKAALRIDTGTAHSARIYNYWLGGKDNFPADREAAEAAMAANPGIVADVRANRAFLARAVRYLVAEAGIRQFLDIGTGLPTADNTHEVAQATAPESRVVYVDNDPIVLAHARALLSSTPEGATAYLDADLREPDVILKSAGRTLDLGQPVAVVLVGVLHLVPDADQPRAIIESPLAAGGPCSYPVITQPASDVNAEAAAAGAKQYNSFVATPQTRRDHAGTAAFFGGLDLVEPGLVQAHQWRPDPGSSPSGSISAWACVARKP